MGHITIPDRSFLRGGVVTSCELLSGSSKRSTGVPGHLVTARAARPFGSSRCLQLGALLAWPVSFPPGSQAQAVAASLPHHEPSVETASAQAAQGSAKSSCCLDEHQNASM